jgi:hypothetical protein
MSLSSLLGICRSLCFSSSLQTADGERKGAQIPGQRWEYEEENTEVLIASMGTIFIGNESRISQAKNDKCLSLSRLL